MPENLKEENIRLRRAVEELSLLNEISFAIGSAMNVEEITRLIISKCIHRMGVEQGAVTLLKEREKDRFTTFVRVMDGKKSIVSCQLGASLTGWILKNQQPLVVNDMSIDPRFSGVELETRAVKSVLSVPLLVKDRVIGTISVFNKMDRNFIPEDQRLLSIIATQSAQILENARLYEEEKKLRDIEDDLQIARRIQSSLLPKGNPCVAGVDIAGVSLPAREVGGDYYDFIEIDGEHLGLAVGDVSGKGIPAALLMANLQASLRGQVSANRSVKETIRLVNCMLGRSIEQGQFVTLFYGVLDTSTKTFLYTNAGQNPPVVLGKDGSLRRLEKGGLVLGVLGDASYEEEEVQLQGGDLMFLYTDGITEATNDRDEMYGERKVLDLLSSSIDLSAPGLSEKIVESVLTFQGNSEQSDDITLIVVKA
jgi:sigma-B regulation protein RsbU (phosphoserine phosphatase)